jgi:hypothetical protein
MTRSAAIAPFVLAACFTEFDPSLLDGAVVADDAGGVGVCPAVAFVEGTSAIAEPAVPPLPPRSELFRDPTFGACIARLSDHMADNFVMVDPVDRGAMNADATFAMPLTGTYRFHLFDLVERDHQLELLVYAAQQARLSSTDPSAFYRLEEEEPFVIVEETTSGNEIGRYDLEPAILAVFPDATRMDIPSRATSADDAYFVVTLDTAAGRQRAVAVIDLAARSVVSSRVLTDTIFEDSRRVRAALSPRGDFVAIVIAFEEASDVDALDIYARDLGESLFSIGAEDRVAGWDFARAADGSDVFVYAQEQNLMRLDLPSTSPVEVIGELNGNPLEPTASRSDVLISGAAWDQPGWVVLSFQNCTVPGGEQCAPGSQWGQDKIALVSIDDTPRVINLAWHRSTYGGSRHPRALPSRDLSRVIFESNWGMVAGESSTELFVIELPDVGDP